MRTVLLVILIGSLLAHAGTAQAAKSTTKKKPPAKAAKSSSAAAKPSAKTSPVAKPKTVTGSPKPADKPAMNTQFPSPTTPALSAVVLEVAPADASTSLIVDATGMKLDKSMSPKIVKGDGTVVWGTFTKLTDEQYDMIQESGMVAYAASVEEAMLNSRAGPRPLVIKALSSTGKGIQSDLVVSDEDAAKIASEDAKGGFLARFRVVFVKNENPPPPIATPSQQPEAVQ